MDGVKPLLPRTARSSSPPSGPTAESSTVKPAARPAASPFASPLVRLLAAAGNGAPTRESAAQRWSQWLDWTAAIALHAVLGGGEAGQPADPVAAGSGATRLDTRSAAQVLSEAVQRVRRELAQAVAADRVLSTGAADPVQPGGARRASAGSDASPATDAGTGVDSAALAPFRRHYLAHQRAMDMRIAPLRAQARAALQSASPALASLAALDAVLDQALAARERQLLATVPLRLEAQALGLDAQALRQTTLAADAGAPDTPAACSPAAFLPAAFSPASYGRQLQQVLLAELDNRLLPVQGLLEALDPSAAQARGQHA